MQTSQTVIGAASNRARSVRFGAAAVVATVAVVAVVASGWVPSARVQAHGPVHERIARVTRSIAQRPDDGDAYLIRADLYRAHGDFDAALADLDRAGALDPASPDIALARGRCLLAASRSAEAVACFDRVLSARPEDWIARLGRARAHAAAGNGSLAATDFDQVLSGDRRPTPDVYLERARALRIADTPDFDRIVSGLDEGMTRLGFLIVLQLEAIEVEIDRADFDAALGRLRSIEQRTARKERWLARRGDVLVLAHRLPEALEAYRAALTALDCLPNARRAVAAMRDLKADVEAALARLESELNPAPAVPTETPLPSPSQETGP